jgi:hypothetical protein
LRSAEALKATLEAETVPAMTSEPVATTPTSSEFDRFEDLTRKLVNTPKPEVDKQRKDG